MFCNLFNGVVEGYCIVFVDTERGVAVGVVVAAVEEDGIAGCGFVEEETVAARGFVVDVVEENYFDDAYFGYQGIPRGIRVPKYASNVYLKILKFIGYPKSKGLPLVSRGAPKEVIP